MTIFENICNEYLEIKEAKAANASDEFSCIAGTAPLYHWRGGNDIFSLLKKRGNLQVFFSKNYYYFLLYVVCIAQLLKGYRSGMLDHRTAWSANSGLYVRVRQAVGNVKCAKQSPLKTKWSDDDNSLLVPSVTSEMERERIEANVKQHLYRPSTGP